MDDIAVVDTMTVPVVESVAHLTFEENAEVCLAWMTSITVQVATAAYLSASEVVKAGN